MDADIMVPSVENPELTKALPLKPGVGQNIAVHAVPAARNFFLPTFDRFSLRCVANVCCCMARRLKQVTLLVD